MDPILNKIEPFQLQGIQIRTKNSNEFDPSTAQIPVLWKRFQSEMLSSSNKSHTEQFGVYFNYESDANGSYDVLAGIEVEAPSDAQSVQVCGGMYLVFSAYGEMPSALIECWESIWTYFSDPACASRRAYLTDFEKYITPDQVLVHIGLKS